MTSSMTSLTMDDKGERNGNFRSYAIISGFIVTIGLLVALIILVTKVDTSKRIVCKVEADKKGAEPQVNSETAAGDADRSEHGNSELTVPDCPLNPHSATPELDKAKCVLESYPLIDG